MAVRRRRNKDELERTAEGLFQVLTIVPVWIGPLVALGCYLLLRFLVPASAANLTPPLDESLSGASRMLAPWLAVTVLVLWMLAEFKKLTDRRLLDSRNNAVSLRHVSWQEFERLVGEAFRRQGYTVRETPEGADGGVDLVLERNGERTLVQCKQWKSWKVGVKTIRELYGVVAAERAERGAVVCCGRYTKDARRFAENKPLELIDGQALWSMIEPLKRGASTSEARSEHMDPQPTVGRSQNLCPKCGSVMVLRTASKGPHAGSPFYGCSAFPACRGIRQA